MIQFIGEVSGQHKLNGKIIAHDGEIVKFTFGNIIENDSDYTIKIKTDKHAPNYGTSVELWITNISILKDNKWYQYTEQKG